MATVRSFECETAMVLKPAALAYCTAQLPKVALSELSANCKLG
jgi:hypothetical protein